MNNAVLDPEPTVRATVRIGGSQASLLLPDQWRAQEKPPIGEPDQDVGPGPGDDEEDDDDDDEDDDEDESAR